MPADKGADGIDDIKAKMREALKSKQSHDKGEDDQGHRKEKAPETHGPHSGTATGPATP